MKKLFEKLNMIPNSTLHKKLEDEEALRRQVTALFGVLSNFYGADKLVLRAGKLEALSFMRSRDLADRVIALQRIVFENPNLTERPTYDQIPEILHDVEEALADMLARRTVETEIEAKINERMQDRHEEYIQEIRSQVLKEKKGPENAHTLKKYAKLEKLEHIHLSRSTLELVRPQTVADIVGQEMGIRSLISKMASPYPQHIIIYGPPGVGKTTAARIALKEVAQLESTPFGSDSPFVEVDGTTLRWDPRDITNPLLGSVHDPIYQGARRDLADTAIPEPKLGLVTEAHGGILFIDEIGELDPILQNKLLKVLEDKRVQFDSPYYDPDDANVPKYIKKLFEEGAPADFVLIGATTKDPSEINPALRSRCTEVFFEPLIPEQIEEIVRGAANRLGVLIAEGVAETIARYTIEGRKAVNILVDAYSVMTYQQIESGEEPMIRLEHVEDVLQMRRLHPYVRQTETTKAEVGRIHGLGVSGFLGSIIEIEAIAFPAAEPGKGRLRFNDTAGSMAKDSVFNAAAVFRKVTGQDISDYDVHINAVGGGRIDGPSAGVAIFLAVYSAITNKPIPQSLAVTGEISIQGHVKPVGGIAEKIFGARQAGLAQVLIPNDNATDVPKDSTGIEITIVDSIEDVLVAVFGERAERVS